MGYCLIPEARDLLDLSTDDISDEELQDLINKATQIIIEELTIPVRDEEPTGSIDGVNCSFSVSHYPIADTDGDKVVSTSDVTLYTWTDENDPSTKTSVSLSTIHPREGIIVTSSPPSSSIEKITVDYSYTWEEALNWELIKLACIFLVGYLFAIKKFTILPLAITRGPIRFRHYTEPANKYLEKYRQIMSLIKSKEHVKKTANEMTLARTPMER